MNKINTDSLYNPINILQSNVPFFLNKLEYFYLKRYKSSYFIIKVLMHKSMRFCITPLAKVNKDSNAVKT